MNLRLYDAHNHLQDERFGGRQAELMSACAREGVVRMVVNGSCEEDWRQVLALAKKYPLRKRMKLTAGAGSPLPAAESDAIDGAHGVTHPTEVLPSFGYHPWYVHERSPGWRQNLIHFLDQIPSVVGEIGLDRWKPGLSYEGQEEVFIAQLRLAVERNLPASIHCLQAWGRMLDILKSEPRPARGFLLHSYGGPKEMVKSFADLGAYFSLPGYYAHERKQRQREAFRHVPADRLLIETDAPDQSLPESRNTEPGTRNLFSDAKIYSLADATMGKPINHPANLAAVYQFASALFAQSPEALAARVEQNFLRLFGGI